MRKSTEFSRLVPMAGSGRMIFILFICIKGSLEQARDQKVGIL